MSPSHGLVPGSASGPGPGLLPVVAQAGADLVPRAPERAARAFSPDGEPLCSPPATEQLCAEARRLLPEVEADLRKRLSGPDRSVEAMELEALLLGSRPGQAAPVSQSAAGPAAGPDPLIESGVLVLCAAHLLGRTALLPLSEVLALRGIKVSKGTLNPGQPPRSLDLQLLGMRAAPGLHGPGSHEEQHIEVYRGAPTEPAARTLLALSAAGLSRPLVLTVAPTLVADQPVVPAQATFVYAGLSPELRDIVVRAASPHVAVDAAAAMAPLVQALSGRNPWRLYRVAQVVWRDAWTGQHTVHQPQLTEAGQELARHSLGRPPDGDEAFVLACQALSAAERLCDLVPTVAPDDSAPYCQPPPAHEHLRLELIDALTRLTSRCLLPMQDGEAPLFLRASLKLDVFVLDAHHPDEMGRLLTTAGPGCYARVRLFHFPRESPHALSVTLRSEDSSPGRPAAVPTPWTTTGPATGQTTWPTTWPTSWYVDGGDLRVHVELVQAGSLLQGSAR